MFDWLRPESSDDRKKLYTGITGVIVIAVLVVVGMLFPNGFSPSSAKADIKVTAIVQDLRPSSAPLASNHAMTTRATEVPAVAASVKIPDWVTKADGHGLSRIAEDLRKQGVNIKWEQIYNRNKDLIGPNPNLIKPGMSLVIDPTASAAAPAAPAPVPQKAAPAPAPAAPRQSAAGFVHPLGGAGTCSSGYGNRSGGFHEGVDMPRKIGTRINSIASGTVVKAGPASGYGQVVVIKDADGKYAEYGHVNTMTVSAGQHVNAGQEIATVGNRGESTGPHLHLSIATGLFSGRINPMTYMQSHGISLCGSSSKV